MKTTFIATVLNERESIEEFLKSISTQTKKPNEVIIVDGNSSDGTKDIIKKYKNYKLYTKKGNRSVGRNFAITKSDGEIIIVSDAGCVLDKNFIKNITQPFDGNLIDVVSGFYYPVTNSLFEKCLATYTCVMPDRIDKNNFLPSSRSIAFRKDAWKEIGGYPEALDTCEDLVFADTLKKQGYKFKFQKNAIVHWRQQKNLKSAFRQFFNYAKGDGQAMYIRPQTPLLILRYVVGILFLITIIQTKSIVLSVFLIIFTALYILWSIKKNYKYVRHWKALVYLPLLQFSSDIAVLFGMSVGSIIRLKK